MIMVHNRQAAKHTVSQSVEPNTHVKEHRDPAKNKVKNLATGTALFLPGRAIIHNTKAGLNPLVDAAGYLFSVLGKLKYLKSYRHLGNLQKELIQEITAFHNTIKNHGYHTEFIVICRYVICATFDDIILNTPWGGGQWESHSLLSAFNQDTRQKDRFFNILELALKEPPLYIDLMELIYICLSMGYKGQYRSTEHNQYQLEQITNNLYKHIRAYRGAFSKTLSPTPLKVPQLKSKVTSQTQSLLTIFLIAACIIMIIFVSLGYLLDVISNEAYKNVKHIKNSVSYETTKQ